MKKIIIRRIWRRGGRENICEAGVREAEKRYKNFKIEDSKEIFDVGTKPFVNIIFSQGRTKNKNQLLGRRFVFATTSFLLIKPARNAFGIADAGGDGKAYWWSLCDSGVAQFNKKGKQLFISPNSWDILDEFISKKFGNIMEKERSIILHRDFRNNSSGVGYGVTTGEETAKLYLNTGVWKWARECNFCLHRRLRTPYKIKRFCKNFYILAKRYKKSFELFDFKIAKRIHQNTREKEPLLLCLFSIEKLQSLCYFNLIGAW